MASLLSTPTLVEAPFIIVKIGNYTFGNYSKKGSLNRVGGTLNVTYPNYLKSIQIDKLNGTINQYTLNLIYQITQYDDPNLLEKVFSSVSKNWKITLSYGDYNSPSFIYKEEEALITDIRSTVDFRQQCISYTIKCVSTAFGTYASKYPFNAVFDKPSNVIKRVLKNKQYGLQDIFKGMIKDEVINQLIASDDKSVQIEAKNMINPLNYINYLVSCMTSYDTPDNSFTKNKIYSMVVIDDVLNKYGGCYFEVRSVPSAVSGKIPFDTYELDIGYPGNNFVTSFNINNDQVYSRLIQFSEDIPMNTYKQRINDNGQLEQYYSPQMATDPLLYRPTEAYKNWWTQVTNFPISATVTIKGLLRPSILMQYVNINTLFYGQKHISSGLYIITKQTDTISEQGYQTQLQLTRIPQTQSVMPAASGGYQVSSQSIRTVQIK